MTRVTRSFLLALALTTAPVTIAAAQEALSPEAISDSAPMAKQARAIAELLLAGDRAKIDKFLAANGAASLAGSATYAADIDQVMEVLKTGARTIVRMDGLGPNRVAAALGDKAGDEPVRAIVVGMDPAAPHRITFLRMARIAG